ncbi:Hypothetical_protein [Hexamita inflata]|uniref:Hypothetical_protein n=1 Tax=Hexamita inflata TaxID=28002 RepID=A0ABP1IAA8_9EUKA
MLSSSYERSFCCYFQKIIERHVFQTNVGVQHQLQPSKLIKTLKLLDNSPQSTRFSKFLFFKLISASILLKPQENVLEIVFCSEALEQNKNSRNYKIFYICNQCVDFNFDMLYKRVLNVVQILLSTVTHTIVLQFQLQPELFNNSKINSELFILIFTLTYKHSLILIILLCASENMKNEYISVEYIIYIFSTNSRVIGAKTTKQWLVTFIHHPFLSRITLRNLETKQYKSRNIFVRIIVSAQVEQKQAHKYILLYRPQEKLNIWKMEVSSSQFINKILILENSNFSQLFQKQKRPSPVVMMLSCTTTPIHNDMTYLDYY